MLCACGCGQEVAPGQKWIRYHWCSQAGVKSKERSPWNKGMGSLATVRHDDAEIVALERNEAGRKRKAAGNRYSGSFIGRSFKT